MNDKKLVKAPKPMEMFSNEIQQTGRAIHQLPGKIIGYNDLVGVYEMTPLDDTPDHAPIGETHIFGVGFTKFVLERGGSENFMRFSYVSRQLRWLQGEILTILEASIDDDRRLKAVKDLVKDKISAKISLIYENCGTPEEEQDALEETA